MHRCDAFAGAQATSGEPGDADNFSEFVKANLKLYTLRNQHALTTHAAANYTRNELATALRKARRPRRAAAAAAPASPRAVNPNAARACPAPRAPQAPYQTNLLIAGWDADAGPSLYYLDYMACLHKMSTASHGYGARPPPPPRPRWRR